MIEEWKCKDGKHIGINNTTGRCPLCGEQLKVQRLIVRSVAEVNDG